MSPPKKNKTTEEILAQVEKEKQKQSERNKAYYNKVKDTPEWKARRHRYYEKSKLKAQQQKETSIALS